MRMCKIPGCAKIADTSTGYCPDHRETGERLAREREARRSGFRSYQYKHLYHTKEWRTFRARFLAEHPVCERCGGPADTVDHETDHKGDISLFFNNRFHALCRRCHSMKPETARLSSRETRGRK